MIGFLLLSLNFIFIFKDLLYLFISVVEFESLARSLRSDFFVHPERDLLQVTNLLKALMNYDKCLGFFVLSLLHSPLPELFIFV